MLSQVLLKSGTGTNQKIKSFKLRCFWICWNFWKEEMEFYTILFKRASGMHSILQRIRKERDKSNYKIKNDRVRMYEWIINWHWYAIYKLQDMIKGICSNLQKQCYTPRGLKYFLLILIFASRCTRWININLYNILQELINHKNLPIRRGLKTAITIFDKVYL